MIEAKFGEEPYLVSGYQGKLENHPVFPTPVSTHSQTLKR